MKPVLATAVITTYYYYHYYYDYHYCDHHRADDEGERVAGHKSPISMDFHFIDFLCILKFECVYLVKARSRLPRTRSWNFAQEQWDIRGLIALKNVTDSLEWRTFHPSISQTRIKDVNLLENDLTLDQVNLDWPCAGLMKRRPSLNIKTTTFNSHRVFCRSQFPWYNFKRNDSTVQSVFSTFPLHFRCQDLLRQCGAFLPWKCLVG